MTWHLTPALSDVDEWLPRWQAVNVEWLGGHPLLDQRFIRPLIENFAPDDLLLAECVTAQGPIASLLLHRASRFRWTTFLPSQACIGSAIFSSSAADGMLRESVRELCAALPGLALVIDLPKHDPAVSQEFATADDAMSTMVAGTTCSVPLRGTFSDYWDARPKRVRQSMSRVERRFRETGKSFRLETRSAVPDMTMAVKLHGDLETSGWKGKEGTALALDNVQGRFYLEVMERFASDDGAKAYCLYIDDAPAASLLTIRSGEMEVVLKTAHNESLRDYSPGRFIDYLVMQQLLSAPSGRTLEMYTNASSVERQWWPDSRDILHLTMFRIPALHRARDHLRKLRRNLLGSTASPELRESSAD